MNRKDLDYHKGSVLKKVEEMLDGAKNLAYATNAEMKEKVKDGALYYEYEGTYFLIVAVDKKEREKDEEDDFILEKKTLTFLEKAMIEMSENISVVTQQCHMRNEDR